MTHMTPAQAAQQSRRSANGEYVARELDETTGVYLLSDDEVEFARETLGPDATDDEIRALIEVRADRDDREER